jgi:hypothetical protein
MLFATPTHIAACQEGGDGDSHLASPSRTRAEVSRTPGKKSDVGGAQKNKNNRETGRGGARSGGRQVPTAATLGDLLRNPEILSVAAAFVALNAVIGMLKPLSQVPTT